MSLRQPFKAVAKFLFNFFYGHVNYLAAILAAGTAQYADYIFDSFLESKNPKCFDR